MYPRPLPPGSVSCMHPLPLHLPGGGGGRIAKNSRLDLKVRVALGNVPPTPTPKLRSQKLRRNFIFLNFNHGSRYWNIFEQGFVLENIFQIKVIAFRTRQCTGSLVILIWQLFVLKPSRMWLIV